ncbi:NAD(P)-binding protein [Amniculicola lignicola CBS 123094]|uniref:NAD(P)-binding protein n=1 Tax=Amniculicola lignicola CBS 123094 TaxID=1392246 RepID=A0A6A5WK57_9PLEO|nr:NAD(P)-binding protein [Amniculicola lignicola CBS 123094]
MPTTRGQAKALEMDAALKIFFSSPRFAVAGASSDTSKYGHKVFLWYLRHSLPVTPLNPRSPSIQASPLPTRPTPHTFPTTTSPSKLESPAGTSISIITPPAVTKALLREAKEAGVPAVWLQPGSYDEEGLEYARREFKAAIADGWCVLVDGEEGLRVTGREWEVLQEKSGDEGEAKL